MALDATIGGAASNSYLTQAAATAYFTNRPHADAWSQAVGDGSADQVLLFATRILDGEQYVGAIVTATQALQWPRYGVPTPTYGYYATTVIPQCVLDAECELALAMVEDPTMLSAGGFSEFANLQLGDLDVTPKAAPTLTLPPLVQRLLRPVLVLGSAAVARVDRA